MSKSGLIGLPDDSNVVTAGQIQVVADMGELAARLGSVAVYHRSGNVLAIEDFSAGLGGVEVTTGGGNSAAVLTNYPVLSRGVAAQMIAGPSPSYDIDLRKHWLAPQEGGVGWEFAFSVQGNLSVATFMLVYHDGTNVYTFSFFYNKTSNLLQISHAPAATTTLDADPPISTDGDLYNHVKLIVDLETHLFNRLYVNAEKYLLGDYEATSSVSAATPQLYGRLFVTATTGTDPGIIIDNLILTQNEEITIC